MLDARKAAVRGVSVSGVLSPSELPRLRSLLASDKGLISAELAFSRDEDNRYLVRSVLSAELEVNCQRCLDTMTISLASDNSLALVWTDEQAAHLPRDLDPLILGEENCSLWDLVEDELILALPAYSYHETEDCKAVLAEYEGLSQDTQSETEGPNPFGVLAQLKRGEEQQ
jgi:uncharacterized protein